MNQLHALLVRRYGRQVAYRYSLAREAGYQARVPSLAELGYLAGLVVMLVFARES